MNISLNKNFNLVSREINFFVRPNFWWGFYFSLLLMNKEKRREIDSFFTFNLFNCRGRLSVACWSEMMLMYWFWKLKEKENRRDLSQAQVSRDWYLWVSHIYETNWTCYFSLFFFFNLLLSCLLFLIWLLDI